MPEEKDKLYSRIGFGAKVGFGEKPAVVVIDIQKAFTDPRCTVGGGLDDMVENAIKVINLAKGKNVPIIYTVLAWKPDASDSGGLYAIKMPGLRQITLGSEWAELDDRLPYDAEKDYFITKKQSSAFFGTHLPLILTNYRIDTLILTGDSTSGCVRCTAQDGLMFGYRVIVPRECVADRSKEAHESNLFDINAKIGDVVSMAEVIAYLQGLK